MMKIEIIDKNIGERLTAAFESAIDVSVAVAMVGDKGYELLRKYANKKRIRIVTGINLPTPYNVLSQLRTKFGDNARVFKNSFFHPKVYLFTMADSSHQCFVGSSNFTDGGLQNNVELSVCLNDDKTYRQLSDWFEKIYSDSIKITDRLLEEYKISSEHFIKEKRKFEKGSKDVLHRAAFVFDQKRFKDELVAFRQSPYYNEHLQSRKRTVSEIRKALDMRHGFNKIDLKAFLAIKELGHIIPMYVDDLNKAVKNGRFARLCRMLCDNKLSISERYDAAMNKYKVKGCGRNIVTKILVAHDSSKYFLWNAPSEEYLKYVEVSFERGSSEGMKYESLCLELKKLCQEAGIDDFAVLDYFMWEESND